MLAIVIVGYDFTCGHMDEGIFSNTECPLCSSFHSIVAGPQSILGTLFLLSVIFAGISFAIENRQNSTVFLSTYTLRGPPVL